MCGRRRRRNIGSQYFGFANMLLFALHFKFEKNLNLCDPTLFQHLSLFYFNTQADFWEKNKFRKSTLHNYK